MKENLTIERGRGMTYANNDFTVYRHGIYPRSSVLAGQDKRSFVNSYSTLEEARKAYPQAEVLVDGGSTYQALNLNHLPDDGDY